MTTTTGVSKLKELLFDQESATIAELERRIGLVAEAERLGRSELAQRIAQAEAAAAARLADAQSAAGVRVAEQVAEARAAAAAEAARLAAAAAERLASLEAEHQRARADLLARIEELNRRTGTPNALRASVAEVIDDVIVDARGARHDQMARAVAPLVVKTIKTELRNSQDEMVEALYPITGRLVKAYVASAMKDMMNQINRRLEMNPTMLRFRSIVSGYSMAELALADTQRLSVDELYLIRRGSGALIQRWPQMTAGHNRDIHMSGVLAAINDFAGHAFHEDGGNLRSFNVDDFTVFLRGSPVYLLAAKCRGTPVPGVESMIDAELLDVVSHRAELEHESSSDTIPSELLAGLAKRIETGVEEHHEVLQRAGLPFHPLKVIAAVAILALIAGGGWYGYGWWQTEQVRTAAQSVIDERAVASADLKVRLAGVGWKGVSLDLAGFAPSAREHKDLIDGLGRALPGLPIRDEIVVLPGPGPDPRPQIDRVQRGLESLEAGLARQRIAVSLDRAMRRLEQATPDLDRLTELGASNKRAVAQRASTSVRQTIGEIAAERKASETAGGEVRLAQAMRDAATRLQAIAVSLTTLIGDAPARAPAVAPRPSTGTPEALEAAEDISLAAERVATIAAAAVLAGSIKIPVPAPPPAPAAPTPRERLIEFSRTHAVFFGDADGYRAPDRAETTLAELARLMKGNEILVRLVGYTDERGGLTRNAPLSQSRADKVLADLVARGIPRERLVAIGRANGPDISTTIGPQSANRRVEFEIGFEGEAGGP